jgi:hypothetical protein
VPDIQDLKPPLAETNLCGHFQYYNLISTFSRQALFESRTGYTPGRFWIVNYSLQSTCHVFLSMFVCVCACVCVCWRCSVCSAGPGHVLKCSCTSARRGRGTLSVAVIKGSGHVERWAVRSVLLCVWQDPCTARRGHVPGSRNSGARGTHGLQFPRGESGCGAPLQPVQLKLSKEILLLLERPNLFAVCNNNTFIKWWAGFRMSCRRVLSSTPLLVRGSETVWDSGE